MRFCCSCLVFSAFFLLNLPEDRADSMLFLSTLSSLLSSFLGNGFFSSSYFFSGMPLLQVLTWKANIIKLYLYMA